LLSQVVPALISTLNVNQTQLLDWITKETSGLHTAIGKTQVDVQRLLNAQVQVRLVPPGSPSQVSTASLVMQQNTGKLHLFLLHVTFNVNIFVLPFCRATERTEQCCPGNELVPFSQPYHSTATLARVQIRIKWKTSS
jgi:hypothetical protein